MASVERGPWSSHDSAGWQDPEMSLKYARSAEKVKNESKNSPEWVDGGYRSSGEVSLSAAREVSELTEKYERYAQKVQNEAKSSSERADGGFRSSGEVNLSAAQKEPELAEKFERYAKQVHTEAKSSGEWSNAGVNLSAARENPELVEKYERYVIKAKMAAKKDDLLKSIEYFKLAYRIYPSEKIKGRIAKLEEAYQLRLQDENDDEFVEVLGSGLMLYKQLYDKLFEHQKEGVAFLYSLYRDGRKGGILADDMGLGKTIQVIAFLSGMFDNELARTILLIMPTTLISNWIREFEKWTPGMRVSEFHGVSKKERSKNLEKIQRKGGILITTYQMLINNWQQLSTYNGREFIWDYVILDEAHKIKSSSTKTSKSCAAVPAKNRVLLTGTPVQNNLREMWALYDYACQGTLLGTAKTFKMEYENPITRARERDATPGEKALGLKISENLMNIIKPYFLRRTKSDVQQKKAAKQHSISESDKKSPEMPSLTRKNDFIMWVYLSPIQEEIYRKFISLDQIQELLMTSKSPLAQLNILKKLCDHPRLLSARACIQLGLEGDEMAENEVAEELEPVTKFDHLSDEVLIEESGKLFLLIQLLHKLRDEGHRTLVFSQSRKMLDMVDRILTNKGFKIMRIDGTVALLDREKRISLFQKKDYSVLLLTTQVGGVGLTLTAADRVVIFDPSWNPATDAQAVDRAYRIGQQANVVIYRLITCGTVEEKIYRRQIFKDSLIRQTTGDKKNPFRYFSKQELKELFTLEDTHTSTTQIQLQNMHSAQRKTDTNLDQHIAYLHTLPIFGISDHDLVYAHEVSSHEDEGCDNAHEVHYINERVQKAHELVQMESQMNKQLIEQIQKGTEGAWLRQVPPPEKPKQRSLPNTKPVVPPVIVDLTQQEIGDLSCHMDSLVIEDPSGATEENEPVPVKREMPDQFNGQVTNLISDDYSENYSSENKGTNDIDCQMASVIIEDSDGEEELPPAPFHSEPPSENCIQRSFEPEDHAEEKEQMPSVLHQSALPTQEAHGDVSNGHHNTGVAASNLSVVEISSPLASPQVSNMSKSFNNKSIKLEQSGMEHGNMSAKESVLLNSQLQCDFNLILDDSFENDDQGVSTDEMDNVMETSVAQENGPLLVLDDSQQDMSQECSDENEKSDLKSEAIATSMPRLGSSPGIVPKGDMTATNSHHDEVQANGMDIDDEEEVFHTGRRKAARRICSDSEGETSVFGDENERVFSPFSSPSAKGLSASTPKHTSTPGRRRSIASRRSLVHVAVEEAIDVEESFVAVNEESSEEEEDIFKEEAEEAKEEEEPETSEEPAGETLPDKESVVTSEEYESDSFVVKTSEEEFADESTGEVELASDEQVDCLAQDTEGMQQKTLSPEERYSTLVQRGKFLKDSGKVKEALDCFLKALDIKSGEPEVMMITLGLYRQLS